MKRGIVALAVIAVAAIVGWLVTPAPIAGAPVYLLAQLFGALALTGLACTLFISTRAPVLDWLFGGLDKAYILHKWMGIGSLGFVVVHVAGLLTARGAGEPRSPVGPLGRGGAMAVVLFVVLILIALVAQRINYETWRRIHGLMIVPFAVGLVHYYGSTSYNPFELSAFGLWMDLVALFGLISGAYTLLVYSRAGFGFSYTVSKVRRVSEDIVEITGHRAGRPMTRAAGQFVFVQFPSRGFPSHPFTISNAPDPDTVQLTIKAAGDDTIALTAAVSAGDKFVTSGPYGRFTYLGGAKRQIWLAGGIGITPFRSFWQAGIPEGFQIDFFYGYEGAREGAYLDELAALDNPALRIHTRDAEAEGFWTGTAIAEVVGTDTPVDIYFCGPPQMRADLRRELKATALPVAGFHYEQFKFGRPGTGAPRNDDTE